MVIAPKWFPAWRHGWVRSLTAVSVAIALASISLAWERLVDGSPTKCLWGFASLGALAHGGYAVWCLWHGGYHGRGRSIGEASSVAAEIGCTWLLLCLAGAAVIGGTRAAM
jgi:hypothetical protein